MNKKVLKLCIPHTHKLQSYLFFLTCVCIVHTFKDLCRHFIKTELEAKMPGRRTPTTTTNFKHPSKPQSFS